MNKLLKKLGVVVFPSIFWIGLTALGFGAQSLSNLIKLFGVLILSIICVFIPERIIKFNKLILLLLFVVFLVRFLTPVIPE